MIKRLVAPVLMLCLPVLGPLGVRGSTAGGAPSCAAIRAADPGAADGDYAIRIAGATIPVYCHAMGSDPVEYIDLAQTGGAHNFSQYTAGGASGGVSVVTHYTRLRIDRRPASVNPVTFRVDIADQTFATSSGQLCHSSGAPCSGGRLVVSMPYAVAFDCVGPASARGIANVDLSGTIFDTVNTFSVQGFDGGGATAYTPQVVNLTGGGYCGWNAPAATYDPYGTNPLQDANKGFDLQLRLHVPNG